MTLTESEWKLLLAVSRKGSLPIMSYEERGFLSGMTVAKAADSLIQKGLVADDREAKPPFRRRISLTIFGRKVAPLLEQAEEYIRQAQNVSTDISFVNTSRQTSPDQRQKRAKVN